MSEYTQDQQILIDIVREMADAQTADQIMKHWAKDVVWLDITAHSLFGYDAVYAEFEEQFAKLRQCGATLEYVDCKVSGDLGVVTTLQKFWAILEADGSRIEIHTRQTDMFERRNGTWELVQQHISLPISGVQSLLGQSYDHIESNHSAK